MHAVHARRRQGGFTLTELLVATAIFTILMSALVTLFSSAVSSARQGYANIDAFETGRVGMTTINRDLTGAFASREFGEVYNFYGQPDGFMFVGALDGGQIGRVTYAFHPNVGVDPVRIEYKERWGVVASNIRNQVMRFARARGGVGQQVEDAADQVIIRVAAAYNLPLPYPPEEWVTFDVALRTERLIRYEEAGVNDLDTYNMYVKLDASNAPFRLDWPYVDSLDASRDASPAAADPVAQMNFLLGALDPTPGDLQYDLREMYRINKEDGGWVHPVSTEQIYLRALGPDVFDQMLKSRKREFWIRMLSGEAMGVPELAPNPTYGSVGYWYDEAFNVPNVRQMKTINEYIVADGIVASADLLEPDTDRIIEVIGRSGVAVDALDADIKFAYGDGNGLNAPLNYFNAIENLRDPDNPDGVTTNPAVVRQSVPMLLAQGTTGYVEADLIEADKSLSDNMLGTRSSRKNMGSLLAPRVPAVVSARFWVTRNRTRPGSPEVLKRFAQSIQIPTATGRSVAATVALSPGGSL